MSEINKFRNTFNGFWYNSEHGSAAWMHGLTVPLPLSSREQNALKTQISASLASFPNQAEREDFLNAAIDMVSGAAALPMDPNAGARYASFSKGQQATVLSLLADKLRPPQ